MVAAQAKTLGGPAGRQNPQLHNCHRPLIASTGSPSPLAQTSLHHSSLVMLGLLLAFAVVHSGGASLRAWGAERIGERAWRLLFAAVSIPSAVVVIGYFLAHRYDGLRLWNLQDQPWIIPVVWLGTAISFLFLYPATYNLLEIPAVLKPQVRLYATGIIRISRHPQAVGQILWCATHLLWIGSSFMVATCVGLIAHHLFAIWNGDRRLSHRFGEAFLALKAQTSVIPFRAVLDGRQQLVLGEFLKPAQLGIAIAVGVFWWAHRFIGLGATTFSRTGLAHWLG
jgi:uncharacterized membrane protein